MSKSECKRINILKGFAMMEGIENSDRTAEVCSVCAGEGEPISGRPCICGGHGTLHHEAIGLRLRLIEVQAERNDYIMALEYILHATQLLDPDDGGNHENAYSIASEVLDKHKPRGT